MVAWDRLSVCFGWMAQGARPRLPIGHCTGLSSIGYKLMLLTTNQSL